MKLQVDIEYFFMPVLKGSVGGLSVSDGNNLVFDTNKFNCSVVFINPEYEKYQEITVYDKVALFFIVRNNKSYNTSTIKRDNLIQTGFLYNNSGSQEYQLIEQDKIDTIDSVEQRVLFHIIPTNDEHAFVFANAIDRGDGDSDTEYFEQLQLMNLHFHERNKLNWLEPSKKKGLNTSIFLTPIDNVDKLSEVVPITEKYSGYITNNLRSYIKITSKPENVSRFHGIMDYVTVTSAYLLAFGVLAVMISLIIMPYIL